MFIMQENGMTALNWAAQKGHKQVVDVLLKAGASPDIQDKVPYSGKFLYGANFHVLLHECCVCENKNYKNLNVKFL